MHEDRFKNLYEFMLKNKELKQLMPKATGEWEQDKDKFIKLQLDMENMANFTDVDL